MVAKLALCACLFLGADGPAPAQPKPDAAKPKVEAPAKPAAAEATAKPKEAPEPKEAAKPKPKEKEAQPAKPKDDLIEIERAIIDRTNAERARYGLVALEVDHELVKTARAHATWMTLNQTLQHTRLPVAENIAMGQRDSQEVVADWMRSPGHRSNILNRSYRKMGAAAYRTVQGTIYWCQQFRP